MLHTLSILDDIELSYEDEEDNNNSNGSENTKIIREVLHRFC